MKLRARHNSIRFRLGQSEVRSLRESGECRETIEFPGGSRLEYVLSASEGADFDVSFADGVVFVAIPAQQLGAWYSPNQVGMSAEVHVRPGTVLEVLIEKDFRCVDDQGSEDQSDTFENPLAASLSC
jgi:hypothetical protein